MRSAATGGIDLMGANCSSVCSFGLVRITLSLGTILQSRVLGFNNDV